MSEERLPLLRGRITSTDTYQGQQVPRGGPARLPSLDAKAHSSRLLEQLKAIHAQVKSRPVSARDELASREIIAVHPAADAALVADQLDGRDAWLVGFVPETGAVLLDVADGELAYLRKKVEAFGDDASVKAKTKKDGTPKLDDNGRPLTSRASENAVAPIDRIGLASLDDVKGTRLRTEPLVSDRGYWFEVACRGGYRQPLVETERSRSQIARQLHRIGAAQKLDEFIGPEQVYFFLRLTPVQLEALRAATDCIYEVELAPAPLRDLKLLDDVTTQYAKTVALTPPSANAPSIVLLDTGIATEHPLLKAAILSSTKAGDEISGVEDTFGHGTKMAGVALHRDLGASIEEGKVVARHWLQSSRLLVEPGRGTASDENYEKWPVLTLGAVRAAEDADQQQHRGRVFLLAVTRSMQDAPLDGLVPTLWSHAVDQIAFNDGRGRLLIVSAGNARYEQWLPLAQQHPALQLSEKIHQPAQAINALTVGAFTMRSQLPHTGYAEAQVVAPAGGISPFTSTGIPGNDWPIKPDVVLEGGNLAVAGSLPDPTVPSLCALTTSHRHMFGQPLGQIAMTSEAAARAAHLAATIWAAEPTLRPETVRALIVHSASWTATMRAQFPGLNDRLQACGLGVPDERLAAECTQGRATIWVEDTMPNAVVEQQQRRKPGVRATARETERVLNRKVKLYRVPIPESLLSDSDPDVELRVTLSYLAEPNKFGRSTYHGLDLKWDMQGPQESEDVFLQRINIAKRPKGPDGKPLKPPTTKSFDWDLKIQARSRGTVQSDRWRGKMSSVVGDKLIAIIPVLGWWDQRRPLKTQAMPFSLVVSVLGHGVYSVIKARVEAEVQTPIEV